MERQSRILGCCICKPRIASNHQNLGERHGLGERFLQSLQKEATLIPKFWPPELREAKFLLFSVTKLVEIFYRNLGN